jgi:dihydrofolate reductase
MLRAVLTISLDGFAAGPDPTEEQPLGEGGERLHDWAFELEAWRRAHGREGGAVNESSAVMERNLDGVAASVMGRGMFGGGPGPWGDEPWEGWWGDDPPFRRPVFVLTHHPREPLVKEGGTTFHFVTEGVEAAVERAVDAAAGADVLIDGGPSVIRQCLAAGLLDELQVSVAPILLGGGTRLFPDGLEQASLEQLEVVEAPGVAHLRYRVDR